MEGDRDKKEKREEQNGPQEIETIQQEVLSEAI